MEHQHNVGEWDVEVAYATPSQQVIIKVRVPAGATIRQVIAQSRILEKFPEIDLIRQSVGIFGEMAALDDVVHNRDRIEIYRALTNDPKETRRRREKRRLGKTKGK